MSAWREEKKTFSLLFSDGNDVDNGDVVAMLAAAAEETMTLLCCCAVVVLCCCVVLNYYDTKTCISFSDSRSQYVKKKVTRELSWKIKVSLPEGKSKISGRNK